MKREKKNHTLDLRWNSRKKEKKKQKEEGERATSD